MRSNRALTHLVAFGVYFGASVAGSAMVFERSGIAVLWPATALGVAFVLVRHRHERNGILVAFALAEIVFRLSTGDVEPSSWLYAVSNLAEVLALSWAVRRWLSPRLDGIEAYSGFVGLAIITSLGSSFVAGFATALGGAFTFGVAMQQAFLADFVGFCVITPALVWAIARSYKVDRPIESGVVISAMVASAVLSYLMPQIADNPANPIPYVGLIGLMWSSVRLGPTVTASGSVALVVLSVNFSMRNFGAWAVDPRPQAVKIVGLQVSILVIIASLYAVAVTFADRRRAIESLERSEEQRRRMLAQVSHELKNPITTIIGMADLLISEPRGAESDAMLEAIRRQGDRMRILVQDLLDLSRAELGRLEVHNRGVQIGRCVSFAANSMDPSRVTVMVVNDVVVRGDPVRISQIIVNLVTNSILHGGGAASVRVNGVEVTVDDDGPGVPADIAGQMFEPFVSGAQTGTGLGLAICRALMEAMGGTITYTAKRPTGSRFTIRFQKEEAGTNVPAKVS